MKIISLGAGVQSTVMSLMSACGELPIADAAIFADTQWESRSIYSHLDWLETQLPFPVYRVTAGSIRDNALSGIRSDGKSRFAAVPWFTENGIGMRQCTQEYKLVPIRRKVRELSGGNLCELWIGITIDEATRMKDSGAKYVVNRWPLIEKMMARRDCVKWFEQRFPGIPLRKSSCLGCPYHSDRQWREIKSIPDEWSDVIEVDRAIRHQAKMNRLQFMHRSLTPIDEVDFSTAEERGQINMFENDCEGLCGL